MKSILYNSGLVLKDTFTQVVTLPYNGSVYKLNECNVVLDVPKGVCELTMVNITEPDDEVNVGEIEVTNSGLQVIQWNDFHDLPDNMSVFQIRGKCDGTCQILSLEFVMNQ